MILVFECWVLSQLSHSSSGLRNLCLTAPKGPHFGVHSSTTEGDYDCLCQNLDLPPVRPWAIHLISQFPHVCAHACVCTQLCLTVCNAVDCSPPGSSVHGVSQGREELPFPTPGDLLNPGIEPPSIASLAWAGRFFTAETPGKHPSPGTNNSNFWL